MNIWYNWWEEKKQNKGSFSWDIVYVLFMRYRIYQFHVNAVAFEDILKCFIHTRSITGKVGGTAWKNLHCQLTLSGDQSLFKIKSRSWRLGIVWFCLLPQIIGQGIIPWKKTDITLALYMSLLDALRDEGGFPSDILPLIAAS